MATPDAVIPSWRPLAQSAAIAFYAGTIQKPRLTFSALRIDCAALGLHIVVRGGGGGTGTLSTTVSSFVRDNGLVAGINALPFDPASAKEGEARTNVGIVVADGVLIAPPNPRYYALVWYAEGGPLIVPQADIDDTAVITNAVGGFHQILQTGELTLRAQSSKPRYARSAVGLSGADSAGGARFLYLLAIDGSRSGSIGATEAETAIVLRALGAHDGLNLDGGGSSALALRGADDIVRLVNTPVHGGVIGQERAVAGCLGIRLD